MSYTDFRADFYLAYFICLLPTGYGAPPPALFRRYHSYRHKDTLQGQWARGRCQADIMSIR